jgi:hypothetical protein
MSPRLRLTVPALLAIAVAITGLLLAGGVLPPGGPGGSQSAVGSIGPGDPGTSAGAVATPTFVPSPTPVPPLGGTELYGFLPYWQVSEATAAYLDQVRLSTLALFSVSARKTGALDTRDLGYQRITGDLGRQIIREAQRRGARVELVFTSFGGQRNGVFLGRLPPTAPAPTVGPSSSPSAPGGSPPTPLANPSQSPQPPAAAPWHRTVAELVELALDLGVDGINVDVERLDELDRAAYGEFLIALRAALRAVAPDAQVSVATEASFRGTGNASAAAAAGVDRIFLMGYDYHWSGSQPGASSPVDRSDGLYTLRWSIAQYVEAGVPRDRILLGLPLYGMTWRTMGPELSTPVLGSGATWIPGRHLDVLLDPAFRATRDPEQVSEFFLQPEGDAYRWTFYDSPGTLRAKLALARDQGLAGGGFWAIGYERGLPGYLGLMRDFRAGKVDRSEAPVP